jgi:hypothetical protein
MEAICSSVTSVDFQRPTRRSIPEGSTLHNHRCENLKSYTNPRELGWGGMDWIDLVQDRD